MKQPQSPFRRASSATRSLDVTGGRRRPGQSLDRSAPARRTAPRLLSRRPASPRVRSERLLADICRKLRCDSAALVLLDDSTATLMVRAQAGLPLYVAARSLADATADLEALCGHAVVLENDRAVRLWQPPAECRAAVCVPVSTSVSPVGTLWLFCDTPRFFSDAQVNEAELAAGALARVWAESTPVAVGAPSAAVASTPSNEKPARITVGRTNSSESSDPPPSTPNLTATSPEPLPNSLLVSSTFRDMEIASWSQGEGLGPISEWIDLGTGRLTMAIGESLSGNRSLATACLRGALRVHAHEVPSAGKLMDRLNSVLSELFEEEGLVAHLFLATLDLGTGMVGYAAAGDMLALRMRPSGWQSLHEPSLPLGLDPMASYSQYHLALEPGETLAFVTPGAMPLGRPGRSNGRQQNGWGVNELGKWLSLVGWQSASNLAVGTAQNMPRAHAGVNQDRAVLMVKRELQ